MKDILTITHLSKVYDNKTHALKDINLSIHEGEIFALLGPNGAGKTTLISTICGLVNATEGHISIGGYDHVLAYRKARTLVGLVPQEIFVDIFLTVTETMRYQRGFYGKPADEKLIEKTLKQLSLWDKKDAAVQSLSGGMKRRVLIGKALMNEPKILFLDEPTAGVDVELRKSMWDLVWELKKDGTTIVLTTHYIEEAQEMADRIGVIKDGELKLVEDKDALMKRLGTKAVQIVLEDPIHEIPESLMPYDCTLGDDGKTIVYTQAPDAKHGIHDFLQALMAQKIIVHDVASKETSLEEIFVDIIKEE